MSTPEFSADRIPLSRSQQNLYNGALQDCDPSLYLIGKSYRFHPLRLPGFLAALNATVCENPVQLCVLETPPTKTEYPYLVPRLGFDDIVHVRSRDQDRTRHGDFDLQRTWSCGILDTALVRYTVWTDESGEVAGLDVHAHHIVLDGGATAIIEGDLARHLATGKCVESRCRTDGLVKLAAAHRREKVKVDESLRRVADAVQRELTEDARLGEPGERSYESPRAVAKGVLQEAVTISGSAFDAIVALAEAKQVPLNVLVAAAAVAVHAGVRQSTESLVVHAVDNRFADPALNVATCLVNSVAHLVRFAAFASVRDVVRALDRGYVRAVRRRWLREEHYRRMYLAINRTAHVEALTLNFISEACDPGLRPFLIEAPVATDIGPVEGMTVASVLDEAQRTLELAIWDRPDLPERKTRPRVAGRIAAALESMMDLWDQPMAKAVNEWFEVDPAGAISRGDTAIDTPPQVARAWFLGDTAGVDKTLARRPSVYRWIAWLVQKRSAPGDVMVLTDDDTGKTIDFLIACHLAGCGYSICDTAAQLQLRANTIAEHVEGATTHIVDVASARPPVALDDDVSATVTERLDLVAADISLGSKTAYIMATSGSTGQPKLVAINHGSLALFCAAVTGAYGWGPRDTVLQCAPLTSDISVEEIFGAAACGSELVRSTAMKTGDLAGLARDLSTSTATVIDLPTAVWHLWCNDAEAIDAIRRSCLRQIVIGGEAIRPTAVDRWMNSLAKKGFSLVSSYGPTETTVVVTYLTLACDGATVAAGARLRLGRPLVPGTVFVAFGEVVIVGDLVSAGYLGTVHGSFGAVASGDGSRRRAFATGDRITVDADGFPVFAGRRDDVVKVSGKRIDIADVVKRIAVDPAISDVAVELRDGRLGVWFESVPTRRAAEDVAATARIRRVLLAAGVSAFFVVGVPNIPRKPNGKVNREHLRATTERVDAMHDSQADKKAVGLAQIWSRQLGTVIQPDSSLLSAGIGSLDLISILPDTRRFLSRPVSILDLISADTAANLLADLASAQMAANAWLDQATAAEIGRDLDGLRSPGRSVEPGIRRGAGDAILVLGASGILGTGFVGAVLDLKQSGMRCPNVVVAARSWPECGPWAALQNAEDVRMAQLSAGFGASDLDTLIRDTGARTVVNCIGNTNVLVPYRELRTANVDLVSALVEACARRGARLVHLSTFVVTADVAASQVIDPRAAPYPYAASKAMAELIVADAPDGLDYTIVRLPRVLGEDSRLLDCADILVSLVAACVAVGAYPALTLTEEVTTGRAAAHAMLRLLPEVAGTAKLGRGVTVARGAAVEYAELLAGFDLDELDVAEWKQRLDDSEWATFNPRRWAVLDAWVSLGTRLGGRSYAEYVADFPTIALASESVAELAAPPQSVRAVLGQALQGR